MMRRMMLVVLLAAAVAAAASPDRGHDAVALGGGGGGGGPIPPPDLKRPAAVLPDSITTLSTGQVVVVLHALDSARPAQQFRRVFIHHRNVILDAGLVRLGEPTVLAIPLAGTTTMTVCGTDAVDVPLSHGQLVRVIAP